MTIFSVIPLKNGIQVCINLKKQNDDLARLCRVMFARNICIQIGGSIET